MRIFFDHQIFAIQRFGGISRYFNELAKMEYNGIRVEKLEPELLDRYHGQPKDLYHRGLNFIKRKTGLAPAFGKEQVDQRVRQKFADTNFDVFHPTYYDPYYLDYLQKPFVLTVYDMVHEIFQEYFSLSNPTSHNKRLLCEKASAIIAISENTKKDLVEIFNIPEDRIHAIQLASDFDKVNPVRPEGWAAIEQYILFTGNRWGYKNFYFCVTALSEILKANPHLVLLCTGHPFSSDEEKFFHDLGIRSQVKQIYLKGDEELAWAYRHAALFVFPSLYEGFGFPVLEAFASKCPVISSHGGSLPEVGGDGALYFNPKNIAEIRDAAARVLYDPVTRQHLVEKGLAMFGKFSWEKCRRETAAVYKSLSA